MCIVPRPGSSSNMTRAWNHVFTDNQMRIFQAVDLQALPDFSRREDQLAVVKRKPLAGADSFFQRLMQTTFGVIGQVFRDSDVEDMEYLLERDIPTELQADPFYVHWLTDMLDVCRIFCDTLDTEAVDFCLGTERGCRRYHTDNVPLRALVTYAGTGTEYVPDEAADRRAFADGAPNEKILTDPSAVRFLSTWDVAVFRGGPKGLLHRTPDAALNGPSILMRLDHPSFWDQVFKKQEKIEK